MHRRAPSLAIPTTAKPVGSRKKVHPHADGEADGEETSGVLSLEQMNPDLDNNGVVDEVEKAVYDQMLKADVDGDGFLSRAEVFQVISNSVVVSNLTAHHAAPELLSL